MLGGLIYIEPKESASFETAEALMNLWLAKKAPIDGSYYCRRGRMYRLFTTPGKAKIYFDRIKRNSPQACVRIRQDKEKVDIYIDNDSRENYNVEFDLRLTKN